ncbi:MAG: RsmE family RNA methyltransferase [Candidatus Omnitrophota bacterium]
MHLVFSKAEDTLSGRITLKDKGQVHHLRDVLRLQTGDTLVACNDKGDKYFCKISQISQDKIILEIKEKYAVKKKESLVTIACAIPKKSRMDDIVDKLTQLGIDMVIPLKTERTIVKLDRHGEDTKIRRWNKVALSAAEQSKRVTVPIIEEIKSIEEVLRDSAGFDLKLIPTLSGQRKKLKEILGERKAKNILFFIGPEGDFTEKEVLLAQSYGCIPVTLGETVLRVETAAVAVASFIEMYENG